MSAMQITLCMDSDAFQEDPLFEIGQVFEQIRLKLASLDEVRDREVFPIHDTAGKPCGRVELKDQDPRVTR